MRRRHVREVLLDVARRGITLRCGREEDRLHASPGSDVTPELLEELRHHKAEIIAAMREDEEMRRTGIIQCSRQVFELAHKHSGLALENEAKAARLEEEES